MNRMTLTATGDDLPFRRSHEVCVDTLEEMTHNRVIFSRTYFFSSLCNASIINFFESKSVECVVCPNHCENFGANANKMAAKYVMPLKNRLSILIDPDAQLFM